MDLKGNDSEWSNLNKKSMDFANNLDWGLYRNNIFEMAEFLKKEKKYKQSLELYLNVCYLDLNGPTNSNKEKDEELLKDFPMWDLSLSFLAPGVIKRIKNILNIIDLKSSEIKNIFLEKENITCKNLKLPVSVDEAWGKIEKEILN